MNILITGASGFIGSYLFKYFNEKGFNVYGLVRKKPSIKYTFMNGFASSPNKLMIEPNIRPESIPIKIFEVRLI